MNGEQILAELRRRNIIATNDHFVYNSGDHGSEYVNKDAVYRDAIYTSLLCEQIAKEFQNDFVDVVIGPAMGAIILSHATSYHLSKILGKTIESTYADKLGDNFIIKRGYDEAIRGKRVLVVEDILTTGNSARKVIEKVREYDGNPIGIGVLCNRGNVTTDKLDSIDKLFALCSTNLQTWPKDECELCKSGVPINTNLGKGSEFLARKQANI